MKTYGREKHSTEIILASTVKSSHVAGISSTARWKRHGGGWGGVGVRGLLRVCSE